MKLLKLISGREYALENDEAEYLISAIEKGLKFIRLSNGDFMAVSSVSLIGDPEKIPFWGGYELSKDSRGYSFMRDGQRCYLEQHNLKGIEFKDDLKYQQTDKVKLLQ